MINRKILGVEGMPTTNTGVSSSKLKEIYTSGTYLKKHPDWHIEESAWKAEQILGMLNRHSLRPQTVCEVGCGAGEILKQLQEQQLAESECWGYDISPQAIELALLRQNEKLHFKVADVLEEQTPYFDLLLMMDVLEHIEDLYSYLRRLQSKAEYKIFHSSLTISAQTVLRKNGLLKVRETYGMVNYFTKETFLRTIEDAGYEIIDHCYTTSCTDLPTHEWKKKLMKLPRKALFTLNKDLTQRILGGYRYLVLAR
jgi:2-polyprenyl-3-methyl-5-hydroxy-6-metoxy-1,4-benzoquinol methylase